MPYVHKDIRRSIDEGQTQPESAGMLAYEIQWLLERYMLHNMQQFSTIAECLGALEAAKMDFQERIVRPYEKAKLKENGDVWNPALIKAAKAGRPV